MKQSRRSSWLIGAILGTLCACIAASRANAAPVVEFQDGMLARGEVIGSDLVLRWRFLSPLPHPLDSITASVHGRPLGVPRIQPYPRSGDRTLAAFLVDTGERARASEIANDSATILALMAQLRSYHDGLVITYSQDAAMLAAKSGQAADLVDAILSLGPEQEKSFRDKAILKALDIMAAAPVSRRVLFVLTDGHSDEQPRVDQVVAAAQRAGTMVTFIVAHSLGLRSVDPEPIATIAARTGGELITATTLDAFLRNPFAMVDSGGESNLPLERGFMLPWELGS